jgi:hypothetical protein
VPEPLAAPQLRTGMVALNAQAIRAHAEFLSSDLLEGRASGSRSYELAAAYVAAQFRQYGLTPAGDADGYLQAVPLVEATLVLPGSSAVLRRDGSAIEFDFSKDYLPSANFFNASSSVTAPLVFAGYGVAAPEYKYDDLADLDLQGKIAVVLEGAPEKLTTEGQSFYAWPQTKYAALAKAGAIGVVEIHHDDRNQAQNSWERAAAMSWVSQMRRLDADNQPAERFPELKLRFRFSADAAARLFGNGHSLEQVLQTAKAGEAQGFALPGTLTLSATTGLRRIESSNVLAMVRGSDPRLQQEAILVAANLDGLGRGAAINGDNIYNGLQRNAVGVAMMLEMARAVAALPVKPKRSIVFAALAAGEKEAQGLQALLADSSTPRNFVAALAINTPMPVTRTTDVLAAGADQSSVGNQLVTATQQLNLRLLLGDDADNSVLMDSLAPLVRAGIPAVAVRSGYRGRNGRNVANVKRAWLQQHIDQASDDLNNAPLDAGAARELTSLNVATLLELANAVERPVWYRSSLAYRKLTRD